MRLINLKSGFGFDIVRKAVCICLFCLMLNTAFGTCIQDMRTFTELMFQNRFGFTNIFTCRVLSQSVDTSDRYFSTVEIQKNYFGTPDTNIAIVYAGGNKGYNECWSPRLYSGCSYLVFAFGGGGRYGISPRTTPLKSEAKHGFFVNEDDIRNELETLQTFLDIFKYKKSGHFVFKNRKGITVAEGDYKKGVAIGIWRHYDDKGNIKAEYDLKHKTEKQFDSNGKIIQ